MIRSSYNEISLLKQVMDSTMNAVLFRTKKRPNYGWIDLKLDAITGNDHFEDEGIRGRKHVYTWIQGRGLEALCSHISWYGLFNGFQNPDISGLRALADSVAGKLRFSLDFHQGHLPFDICEDGRSDYKGNGLWTMSDLFCSRGLYAYGQMFGNAEQKEFGRRYLDETIQAILSGRFYNDQVSFDASQYKTYSDGRTSYAGQMLALGGIVLKMKLKKDAEASQQGRKLIDYVLKHHCNQHGRWNDISSYTIVEWITADGLPAVNADGHIHLDPGHALEFVGLSSQMIDVWKRHYVLTDEENAWVDSYQRMLPLMLKANYLHGFRRPGGIAKSVDARTDEVLVSSMPWWAVPETMRALVLVESLCGDGKTFSKWAGMKFRTCLRAFRKYYLDASPSPIAVQTIGPDGKPEAVIPATPDLDPGYHTGLSMMTCYEVLARDASLFIKKSEISINPVHSCRLSGHVARERFFDGILDTLKARVLILHAPYSQMAWLSLDLLELDRKWVCTIQGMLEGILGIPSSSIIICSTHTHTAPAVINLGTLKANRTYLGNLKVLIARSARLACKMNAILVTARYACGTTDFGINRRYKDPVTGSVSMRPNPMGEIDRSLPILGLCDEAGKYQVVIFNCSVHPTTLGVDIAKVSADYPGVTAGFLSRKLGPQMMAFPVTGACGDTRPALMDIDHDCFRDGTVKDLKRIGQETADEIARALKHSVKQEKVNAEVFCFDVKLEMTDVPSKAELEAYLGKNLEMMKKAVEKAEGLSPFARVHDNPIWDIAAGKCWARQLLEMDEIPTSLTETVNLLMVCGLLVYCVPGELFSSIGMKLKDLNAGSPEMVAGYCGGSVGYLPSASAVKEGGYEVFGAYKYYYLPGRFTSDLEATLVDSMKRLCEDKFSYDTYRKLHL